MLGDLRSPAPSAAVLARGRQAAPGTPSAGPGAEPPEPRNWWLRSLICLRHGSGRATRGLPGQFGEGALGFFQPGAAGVQGFLSLLNGPRVARLLSLGQLALQPGDRAA